jgi:hypothetical protein
MSAVPPDSNKSSSVVQGLGVASLVTGVIGLTSHFCCLTGCLALPLSALGLILGVAGITILIAKRGEGLGLPIAGASVSLVGLLVGVAFMVIAARQSSDGLDALKSGMNLVEKMTENATRMQQEQQRRLAEQRRIEQQQAESNSADDATFTFVDLQKHANQPLAMMPSRLPGNNLSVPTGVQRLGEAEFQIGGRIMQLGSTLLPDRPLEITGIQVGKPFLKLHLLHATMGGAYRAEQGGQDDRFVEDGTVVAQYEVHYEDGSQQTIPIVYGQDLRDWWNWDGSKPVTRAQVAWTGNNPAAAPHNVSLRLYATTWENPYPEKTVAAIDFISANTAAAPFCIAISLTDSDNPLLSHK